MPVNLVKPGQERHWKRARKLAAEQGHEEDYPYIVGVFKRLVKGEGEELSKAGAFWADHSVAQVSRGGRWPGQVPGTHLVREMQREPKPSKPMDLIPSGPIATSRAAVRDLGLTKEQERDWETFVRKTVAGAKTEIEVKQAVNRRARDQELHPVQRSELTHRAGKLARSRLQKSVTVLSADQIRGNGTPINAVPVIFPDEMRKAQAKGGKYYRRIPLPKGGYRYIYDPKKYEGRSDAHVSGEDARKTAITKAVTAALTEAGGKGIEVKSLRALAKKHGRSAVAAHLTELHKSKTIRVKKGRLYAGKKKAL